MIHFDSLPLPLLLKTLAALKNSTGYTRNKVKLDKATSSQMFNDTFVLPANIVSFNTNGFYVNEQ